jgi:hypothetical protein
METTILKELVQQLIQNESDAKVLERLLKPIALSRDNAANEITDEIGNVLDEELPKHIRDVLFLRKVEDMSSPHNGDTLFEAIQFGTMELIHDRQKEKVLLKFSLPDQVPLNDMVKAFTASKAITALFEALSLDIEMHDMVPKMIVLKRK